MNLPRLTSCCTFALTLIVALSLATVPASAQIAPLLTITNIHANGKGGLYDSPEQLRLDALAAIRTTRYQRLSLIAGVSGTVKVVSLDEDLSCPYTPGIGCAPYFPAMNGVGLAVGAEVRNKYVGLTVTGGPGAYHTLDTLLGLMIKADANVYFNQHFGLLASISRIRVANYRGSELNINGVGIGVRVQ